MQLGFLSINILNRFSEFVMIHSRILNEINRIILTQGEEIFLEETNISQEQNPWEQLQWED